MAKRQRSTPADNSPNLFDQPQAPIPVGFCQCGCGQKTNIAVTSCRRRGQVRGQPMRFVPGHSPNKARANQARLRGLKWCNACKTEKPLSAFGPWSGKRKRSSDGRRNTCHSCERIQCKRYREANPEKRRAKAEKYNTLCAYGISREQYWAMHTAQGGVCAICGRPETCKHKDGRTRRLAVDHCHATGKVRALLCAACNNGIGRFEENIENIRRAIAYLEKHRTPQLTA